MRFKISYNWYRFMGITGLCLIGYIVIIGIFGKTDISGLLPTQLATSIETHWPDLPFFTVQQQSIDDGKDKEIYFTVPTRELTKQEIAALKATGPTPKGAPLPPVKSKDTTASSATR